MRPPPFRRWPGGRLAACGLLALSLLAADAPRAAAQEGGRAQPWLGIAMGMTADPAGVHIDHVVHGSPAEKAGLQSDDRIQQVDGKSVATSRDVIAAVGAHAVGDVVTVAATRAGKPVRIQVTLGDHPALDALIRMDHVGHPAPAWSSLEPSAGFPATLGSRLGHVVIVDFWATWCGPCREVAPVLSGWQARYGAMGLDVLGITTDPPEAAAAFKERLDLHYAMASDPRGATTSAFGVSALPTLFVIDKRGIVREVFVGVDGGEEARVEALVKALLAEPAPPTN